MCLQRLACHLFQFTAAHRPRRGHVYVLEGPVQLWSVFAGFQAGNSLAGASGNSPEVAPQVPANPTSPVTPQRSIATAIDKALGQPRHLKALWRPFRLVSRTCLDSFFHPMQLL